MENALIPKINYSEPFIANEFKYFICIIIFIFFCINIFGQTTKKALQVDFFGTSILGIDADGSGSLEREDNLLQYAYDNGYNYLLLLDMASVFSVCCTTTTAVPMESQLSSFIHRAKTTYGILEIGISGGATSGQGCTTPCINNSTNKLFVNGALFNTRQLNDPTHLNDGTYCIDVFQIEDEYWILDNSPAGHAAFDEYSGNFINILTAVYNLTQSTSTANHLIKTEAYLARMEDLFKSGQTTITMQDQANFIDKHSDRVVLAIYFNGNWIQPNSTSAFFERDAFWGKRLELFSNSTSPNDKSTDIIILFSAESSDLSDNNFFGDYLNIIDNGWVFGSGANQGQYDDVYFNGVRTDDKAFSEFMTSFTRTDPYNSISNGTSFGFPGTVNGCCTVCSTATIESCTGFNNTTNPAGNKIVGVMWFKYGLMPGAKFYTFGSDQTSPVNVNFTLSPNERITFTGAHNAGEDIGVNHCLNGVNLTNVSIQDHQWYFWDINTLGQTGHSMFEPISGATNQTYSSGFPLCLGCTARYNYQGHIMPRHNPFYFQYYVRNEMDVLGAPPIGGNYNEIWFTQVHRPGCSNNNGSLTVSGTDGSWANYALVKWDNGSQYFSSGVSVPLAYVINNLTAGTWNVSINFGGSWISTSITLDNLSNNPRPTIFCHNRFVQCDNLLSTTGQFTNYQWYLNGNLISGAVQQTYLASTSGNYTVTVTDQNGCTGQSAPFNLRITPLVNITGSIQTCSTNLIYSVPANVDNVSYIWNVPAGATYSQNLNSITVNWGSAYNTGGVISCTVTNACGGTTTNSLQVTPLSITTTSTSSCLGINNGSACILTVNGTGSYNYNWNSGASTSLITSLAPGTYSVTVTDLTTSCTVTTSIVVNCLPSIPTPVVSGTTSASSSTHSYYITNYYSAYDSYYSWNAIPNSGSATISYPNLNKQTANIQWPSSGGRIEVSFGVNGCNQTNIYYVQPYCQNTYTYDDGCLLSTISNTGSVTRNNMTFNGVLEITSNFTFSNCGTVAFAPGAQILVKANKTLTIDGCTFKASNSCCRMWKGIVLEPGASINISNSNIAQAEVGITVNENCTYTVSGCEFKDNYIGMQIGTGTTFSTSGSSIRATEFYSGSYNCGGSTYTSFLPKYDGQTTNPGAYPLAGIKVDNCTYFKFGNLPNVAGGDIKFHDLSNGIIANNSNIYISNFSFKNIIPDANYSSITGVRNGCGVKLNGGYVVAAGLGGQYNSDVTIANSEYGFAVENGNAEIQKVNTDPDTKVGVFGMRTHEFNVHENCFKTNLIGVWTYSNPDASITISSNDFRMSNSIASHSCIRLEEFNQTNYITVNDNTMKLYLCKFGIYALCIEHGEFKNNSIEMNNNGNVAGIVGLGLQNSTFKCNSINAFQTYSNPQYGMAFAMGSNNAITCNWVNRQQYGLYISSAFNDAFIQGNSFNNNSIGLGLYYNPNISPQNWGGNTWDGTFSQFGAYLSQINANLADANRFYYNPNGSSNNHPHTTNDPGFNWFLASPDLSDFSCTNFDCQPSIPMEEQGNEGDENVAQNNPPGDPVEQTSNYLADQFLFQKLADNPDLLNNNPILQAFYNQQVNGSIGQFNEMTQEISEAVHWETVYSLVYTTNESMLRNKNDSIRDLDSLLELDPSNATLKDQINLLNDQVRDLAQSNELIYNTIQQISDYRITSALYGNSTLPSTEAYEYNQGVINDIYLSTVAQGETTFSNSQLNDIIDIMEQCPYTGGPAVYKARSLYSMVDNTINWNDEAICTTSGVQPRLRKPNNGFSVFPNPSTGIITINYIINSKATCYIEIINTLGEKVAFTRLNPDEKSTKVDLLNLKPAIYFYKIIVNDAMIEKGSLSIVR